MIKYNCLCQNQRSIRKNIIKDDIMSMTDSKTDETKRRPNHLADTHKNEKSYDYLSPRLEEEDVIAEFLRKGTDFVVKEGPEDFSDDTYITATKQDIIANDNCIPSYKKNEDLVDKTRVIPATPKHVFDKSTFDTNVTLSCDKAVNLNEEYTFYGAFKGTFRYGILTATFAALMHYLKSSYVVNPAVCITFAVLSLLADFSKAFRHVFEFILPVYASLVIFDFSSNFLFILKDSILTIFKKEAILLPSAKILGFYAFPVIIVIILACSKTIKKSRFHWVPLFASAATIAYYSQPLDFISNLLKVLSSTTNAGYVVRGISFVGYGLTYATSSILKITIFSTIAKFIYGYLIFNILSQTNELIVLKPKQNHEF